MVTCSSCGSKNAPEAKFCSECGARLASASRPIEERKIVTIVFCDLVGSTARAEQLDPEDVRAELSSYHARVRSELERHGGTVEKFIGDAVVAVFGAPLVHEDDAERAVRSALAIRDWALEEDAVDVRLAVNTGEALVSVDARADAGEGLVAGDVINTAARSADGGACQRDPRRREDLPGDRRTHRVPRAAEPVAAKGKQEPVSVSGRRCRRGRSSASTSTWSRRLDWLAAGAELDLLLDALGRARAEHEPQLVTIVGVPGMGKSRLVQELSARIEADPELIRWRQGRSLPYGEGVSYWALGEMVKAEAGILESDAAPVAGVEAPRPSHACAARERSSGCERCCIPGSESPTRLPAGTGASRHSRRGSSASSRDLPRERATVLVFEDLHWADDGLLDFVDSLIDWATDVPLLVVATARPELLARRPHWGGGKTNAATLSLAPLSETETAELVHAILERDFGPPGRRAVGGPGPCRRKSVVCRGVRSDGR